MKQILTVLTAATNETVTYIAGLPLWLWVMLIGFGIVAALLFVLAVVTRNRED